MAERYRTHFDDQFAGQSGREPIKWHLYVLKDSDDNIERNGNRNIPQQDEILITKIANLFDTSKDKDWLNNQLRARHPGDNSAEPTKDYNDTCCDRKGRNTTALIILGIIFVTVVGGGLMVYISLLSPLTDNTLPRKCEQFPPMFGNNCEFRCHCSNSSEVCDTNFGICQSGCIAGWNGSNCQIITSIFNESVIVVDAPSTHLVQCTINKLWYNWSSVYLTFYNTTETTILINVSQSGEILASDKRLKATLNIANGTEADIVTFAFSFGKDDCDLAGMYRCQFDMVENLNTSYANLSISVRGKSSDLRISTKNVYLDGSTDSINCTLQLADPNAEVILNFIDKDNNTLDSTSVDEQIGFSESKCTNMTTFTYNFNVTQELNQSTAKCTLRDETNGIILESNGSVINVVSRSISAYSELIPVSYVVGPQATFDVFCFIHFENTDWEYLSFVRYIDPSREEVVRIFNNGSIINKDDQITTVFTEGVDLINLTFTFNLTKNHNQCSLIYGCEFQIPEPNLGSVSFSNASIDIVVAPSDVQIHLEPSYQYGRDDMVNCSANVSSQPTSSLLLEVCVNSSYFIAIENYTTTEHVLQQRQSEDENCSHEIFLTNSIDFDHDMNVSMRCKATDSYSNATLVTDCIKPNIPTVSVMAVMEPKSLEIVADTTGELTCFVNVSSYKWTGIHLDFQNESLTRRIVTVNNNTIISYDDLLNTSSIINYEYVNVTFIFNPLTSADGCSLSGNYMCSIDLVDKYIATENDSSALTFSAHATDLTLHLLNQYQYGRESWINCSVKSVQPSQANVSLEVCLNETSFTSIETYTSSLTTYDQTPMDKETCLHEILLGHRVLFDDKMNVSLRCKLDDYINTPLISNCTSLNISTAIVQVMVEPRNQTGILGSTIEIFCFANVSNFEWRVVHLDFKNSSSSQTLISTWYNGTTTVKEDMVMATLMEKDENVNISFILNITDKIMMCSLDGEVSCSIELLDPNVQTISDTGTLSVIGEPSIVKFKIEDQYEYKTTHVVSCEAEFGDNSKTTLEIQKCLSNTYNHVVDDPAFVLNISTDNFLSENCTRYKTVSYSFDFNNVTNGTLLRCLAMDYGIQTNKTTECRPLILKSLPVIAEMTPSLLLAKLDTMVTMECSIRPRGYKWTSINIMEQNVTGTAVVLVAYSNNTIVSQNSRVNGSVVISDEFINVTVSIDLSPGAGVCELNKTYSCDIDLVDSTVQTTSTNSSLIIQAPVSAVEIFLDSSYVSGSNSSINCTVALGDMTDADVKLEGCQGGIYVDLHMIGMAVRDTLYPPPNDQGVNCTNQIIYRYHLPFWALLNNMLVRCHSIDNLYNRSISTTCVSVNVKQVQAVMEPTTLYGEWGSKATFECRIPLSEIYFSTFQFYNDSTSPLLSITAENNFTIPPQNERISAVYISAPLDNYRAVNITFDLRPGDDLCNLIGSYHCGVNTFNESLILPSDAKSHFIIAAPPSNVSIEIEPSYTNGAINETINCTAIINLNTTELSLQYNINGSYTAAPQNITQTIIESEMTDDCRHRVRVINVFAPNSDLSGFNVVCVASDAVLGKESRSKEETLNINNITIIN